MSLSQIQADADRAERDARDIAEQFIAARLHHPANEVAQVQAVMAEQLITNAEMRAIFVARETAVDRAGQVVEGALELAERVAHGLLSPADAAAAIDRLKAGTFDVWLAQHRRDAWDLAVAELRKGIPVYERHVGPFYA